MDLLELDLLRKNTAAFIAVKPVQISLTPKTEKQRTASGGISQEEGSPRSVQTFRIIELGGNQANPRSRSQDGEYRKPSFWLLGEYDAVVENGDFWKEDNRVWTVKDVIRDNLYETRALVEEYGD